MPAGRPPKRYGHVDKLAADDEVKRRLAVMLRSINGEIRAVDAREELGLSETRFHSLRSAMLQGAADALTPGRGGRPRKQVSSEQAEVERLRDELKAAQQALVIERVRSELATTLPGLMYPKKTTNRR